MSLDHELFEVWLDEGAIIIDFNDIASKVSGYTRDEVVGKNWFELFIQEENIVDVLMVFNNLFRNDSLSWKHTNEIVCKDGSIKTLKWKNQIVVDKREKHKLVHSFAKVIE